MKNKKILDILLRIAMICSSLPAYIAVDDMSSEASLNIDFPVCKQQ